MMDDLISRQAAMEAMDRDRKRLLANKMYAAYDMLTDFAMRTVYDLPAAIRWIPCKERLPDKYGFYLVTLNNATTDFCLWNAMEFGWESSGIFNKCDEVTAWMPLPEPYTKEEEE